MKLTIVSIGKLKRGAETDLCEDYLQRLATIGRKAGISAVKVTEYAESQASTAALRQQEEAAIIDDAVPAKALRIVLDERGKPLSSKGFAKLLRTEMDKSVSDIALLIGGPDGHGETIRGSASHVISFGAMTWPHRLVRVMLLEQVYRAVTIMLNHPYHRA